MNSDEIADVLQRIKVRLDNKIEHIRDQFTGMDKSIQDRIGQLFDDFDEFKMMLESVFNACASLTESQKIAMQHIQTLAKAIATHEKFLNHKHSWAYPRFKRNHTNE